MEKRDEPLKRNEDSICIPGQPPPEVCSGPGCVRCPPEAEIEKEKVETEKEKRAEEPICPTPQICSDEGCVPCPLEVETEKEKRAEKVCIPHCVGEHCQCENP